MAKKTSSGRQLDQLLSLSAGAPQFDIDAPEGNYDLDRAIKGKLWNPTESPSENIRRARRIANGGVFYGYSVTKAALVEYPRAINAVESAYEALHQILALANAIAAVEPYDMMCGGARFRSAAFYLERRGAESAFQKAQARIALAAKLSSNFMQRYPPTKRPYTANTLWLPRATMQAWAVEWKRQTGYSAGRGKTGPFIVFAAAVWSDLCLPAIDQNGRNQSDDLYGWLGQLWASQKHPRAEVSRSKSR